MDSQTKLNVLIAGTVVYTLGYVVLLWAVVQGEVGGLSGVAAVLMATGILVALVFGAGLAKVLEETVG